ncbi:MAG: hypothetical protein KDE03_07710 [Rhodobacteraceae bacterium]|nr:hypothetical protein [Paracoccaceae bacterium]
MSERTVEEMAEDVSALMARRLGMRNGRLDEKLRRAGRLLPRKVRREVAYLARAAELAQIPKLRAQLDYGRLNRAHAACIAHLKPLGGAERRKKIALDIATSAAVAVFVVAGLVVVYFGWQSAG